MRWREATPTFCGRLFALRPLIERVFTGVKENLADNQHDVFSYHKGFWQPGKFDYTGAVHNATFEAVSV